MSGHTPLNEITTFERRARRDRRACWGSSLRPPRSLRWTSYFWAAHRARRAKTVERVAESRCSFIYFATCSWFRTFPVISVV